MAGKLVGNVHGLGGAIFDDDLGLVRAVDAEAGELVVDFDGRDVAYDFGELDELVLAYATTIHKTQGSAYPAVVIAVNGQHERRRRLRPGTKKRTAGPFGSIPLSTTKPSVSLLLSSDPGQSGLREAMFDVKHRVCRPGPSRSLAAGREVRGQMAIVIALANQKGGVAKTTSTANLIYALANRGKRVLAIDADPQASLTIYLGHQPFDLQDQERTLYFALVSNVPLAPLVIPGNPALLPSSIRLAKADRELMHAMRYSDSLLRDMIAEVAPDYDYILIDCMPHLGILTSNALTAADLVLIPVRTEYLSIEGIPLILEEVEETRQRSNRGLRILGILPTMYSRTYTQDQEALAALEAIAREQRIRVFDPIARSTEYDKATSQGVPTLVLAPKAPGVEAYYKLADAIIAYG